MNELIDYMKGRLSTLEELAKQGIIPGQLDSIEMIQIKGRIKELKRMLAVAEELINKDL